MNSLTFRHSLSKFVASSGMDVFLPACCTAGSVRFRGQTKADNASRGRFVFISLLFIIAGSAIPAVPMTAGENDSETGKYIDRAIPDSWYEAPQTASELGIEEFQQSPMLDERVANGNLAPVEERLPDDPPVIEPYSEIGEYGGTLKLWGTSLPGYTGNFWNASNTGACRSTPKGWPVPSFIKKWEYSDDFKSLTLHSRKGIKWSDGEPFTSEDYRYAWKHVANNKKLSVVPPKESTPPLIDMSFKDKWTVTFHFAKPAPTIYIKLKSSPMDMWLLGGIKPAHFMKQFHPELSNREKVEQMAARNGIEWQENYTRIENSHYHPEYKHQRPVLMPYVAVERDVSSMIFKRNPYYPFVDPEGNQLPYIDRVRVDLANNSKMAAAKASTGEATFGGWHLSTEAIPLYKRYGKKSGYKTLVYRRNFGAEAALYLNYTHKDQGLREIFNDVRFRKALSLAIDRNDINRKLYFGKAVPQQSSLPPSHSLYRKEYAESYAAYKPEKARRLLNDIGIKDVNEDGLRERPDGSNFNPRLIYNTQGPIDPTSLLEMVINDWRKVGIDFELKILHRSLWSMRWQGNNADATCWMLTQLSGGQIMNRVGLGYFAPVRSSPDVPWPTWANWYTSGGESGIEPPPEIKKLINYAETVVRSPDMNTREATVDKILQSQAENLWSIGTIALAPQPLIVSNRLKNVPKKGLWAWELGGYLGPYRTVQFFLEKE